MEALKLPAECYQRIEQKQKKADDLLCIFGRFDVRKTHVVRLAATLVAGVFAGVALGPGCVFHFGSFAGRVLTVVTSCAAGYCAGAVVDIVQQCIGQEKSPVGLIQPERGPESTTAESTEKTPLFSLV